jgi:hypothetical protein
MDLNLKCLKCSIFNEDFDGFGMIWGQVSAKSLRSIFVMVLKPRKKLSSTSINESCGFTWHRTAFTHGLWGRAKDLAGHVPWASRVRFHNLMVLNILVVSILT